MSMVSDKHAAIEMAQATADANGAPVGVVERDGWYRVVEDADEWNDAPDNGWDHIALCDPSEVTL